jgi:hypothetical protein
MTRKLVWTIGGLAILFTSIYLVTVLVVKPVSMDLSLIGQGKPSLVLAYENFSPTGGAALEQLRKVRGDYEGRLEFIVADLGTPEGRGFANRHRLIDGQALLLDSQGTPVDAWMVPANPAAVRARLGESLDLN